LFDDVIAVATPKQIRELMKVDGLTNNEVKRHPLGGDQFTALFIPNSFSGFAYCVVQDVLALRGGITNETEIDEGEGEQSGGRGA
jgi:hypothetical protein